MATLILVRHGRSTANTGGTLAGRLPQVPLDETGRSQAARAGQRIAPVALTRVVSSPLERCRQTAEAIAAAQPESPSLFIEPQLTECDYGEWQGRKISDLLTEKLWRVVQRQPSAVVFPGGEAMTAMQARAVTAVRRLDAEVTAEAGDRAVWAAVSHGDIIKAILADALGMHLDLFQRLHVDPASVSVIRYHERRPTVLTSNSHSGELGWVVPPPPETDAEASASAHGDAVPGGGSGTGSD